MPRPRETGRGNKRTSGDEFGEVFKGRNCNVKLNVMLQVRSGEAEAAWSLELKIFS